MPPARGRAKLAASRCARHRRGQARTACPTKSAEVCECCGIRAKCSSSDGRVSKRDTGRAGFRSPPVPWQTMKEKAGSALALQEQALAVALNAAEQRENALKDALSRHGQADPALAAAKLRAELAATFPTSAWAYGSRPSIRRPPNTEPSWRSDLAAAQSSELAAAAAYIHNRVALDQGLGLTLEANRVPVEDAVSRSAPLAR